MQEELQSDELELREIENDPRPEKLSNCDPTLYMWRRNMMWRRQKLDHLSMGADCVIKISKVLCARKLPSSCIRAEENHGACPEERMVGLM